jgi:hypothetical protein
MAPIHTPFFFEAAVALLTLVSGSLYANFGAQGFWVMAALCAVVLQLARKV